MDAAPSGRQLLFGYSVSQSVSPVSSELGCKGRAAATCGVTAAL